MRILLITVIFVAAVALATPSAHPNPRPYPNAEAGPGPQPDPNADPSFWFSWLSRIPFVPKAVAVALAQLPGVIFNSIPNFEELLTATKQKLIGYPAEKIMDLIAAICSQAQLTNTVSPVVTPKMEDLSYYMMSESSNTSAPLPHAWRIFSDPSFDRSKKTIIYITGWNSNIHNRNDALYMLYKANECSGEYNFITIDTGACVDTLYVWSSFNTQVVGEYVGNSLANFSMSEQNQGNGSTIEVEKFHIIGHSLGAHIAGAAGRQFTKLTGKKFDRCTALDPARPCFREGEGLTPIERGCCEFTDAIHSNCGVFGKPEALADADFYPNGKVPLMPGVYDAVTSHHRACRYMAETMLPGYSRNFLGTRCNSLHALNIGKCVGEKIPMGMAVSREARGSYYLHTRARSPYGMNAPRDRRPQCVDKTIFNTDLNNEKDSHVKDHFF